jgi:hypothetical protein
LAAVATYRVIAALAALTPKPRQTTTANTAMINLRLVISNGERLARLEDVFGPQLAPFRFVDRRRVVVRDRPSTFRVAPPLRGDRRA